MDGAKTLIRNGLAQNDIDMANHRLINLDTSNLPPIGIPPSIHPPVNQWLHDWDAVTQQWISTQPSFDSLSGNLSAAQQVAITQLGTITIGEWQATPIDALYLPTLDGIRAPGANVSMASNRITNLADPIAATDAVNMSFVDSLLQGLNVKQAVRCATTVGLGHPFGLLTIDGVTLLAGDRVLVKDEEISRKEQNGIYIAAAGSWTRATDADHGSGDPGFNVSNSINGAYCVVLEGTLNAGTSWVENAPVVNIDVDDVNFVLFATNLSTLAGAGLNKVGNTISAVGTANRISVGAGIDIAANYAGQASINTLGTITTGVWNGTVIPPSFGGTGVNNGLRNITLVGNFTTALAVGYVGFPDLTLTLIGVTNVTLPLTGTLATLTGVETLTNKRVNPRTDEIDSNAQPSINTDSLDIFYIKKLSENITSMTANLAGTPVDGQRLTLFIKDDGASHNITWGTGWVASTDLPLPVATTPTKWLFLNFIWHGKLSKWLLTQKLDNI